MGASGKPTPGVGGQEGKLGKQGAHVSGKEKGPCFHGPLSMLTGFYQRPPPPPPSPPPLADDDDAATGIRIVSAILGTVLALLIRL